MLGHKSQTKQRREIFELIRQGLSIIQNCRETDTQFNDEDIQNLINIMNSLESKKNKELFYKILKRLKKESDYKEFKETFTRQIISLKKEKKERQRSKVYLSIQSICFAILLSVFSACATQIQETNLQTKNITSYQQKNERNVVKDLSNYLINYVNSIPHNKDKLPKFRENLEIMKLEMTSRYNFNEFRGDSPIVKILDNDFKLFEKKLEGLKISSKSAHYMSENYVYLPLILCDSNFRGNFYSESLHNNIEITDEYGNLIETTNVLKHGVLVDFIFYMSIFDVEKMKIFNFNGGFKINYHLFWNHLEILLGISEKFKVKGDKLISHTHNFLNTIEFINRCFSKYGHSYSINLSSQLNVYGIWWILDEYLDFIRDSNFSKFGKSFENYERDLNNVFEIIRKRNLPLNESHIYSIAFGASKYNSEPHLLSLLINNNIREIHRFSNKTINWMQTNDPNKKNLLVFIARGDWNGAFSRNFEGNKWGFFYKIFPFKSWFRDFDSSLHRFSKNKFNLQIYEVTNDSQMKMFLDKSREQKFFADIILIAGHGSEEGVSLGERDNTDVSKISYEKREKYRMFDISDESVFQSIKDVMVDRGAIIFDSCSVGGEKESDTNIVDAVGLTVWDKKVRVFGGKDLVCKTLPIFDKDGTTIKDVKFRGEYLKPVETYRGEHLWERQDNTK